MVKLLIAEEAYTVVNLITVVGLTLNLCHMHTRKARRGIRILTALPLTEWPDAAASRCNPGHRG